jgi:hypothetical protein
MDNRGMSHEWYAVLREYKVLKTLSYYTKISTETTTVIGMWRREIEYAIELLHL